MEFATWEELEDAVLGGLGPDAQGEAMEELRLGVDGAYGIDAQIDFEEFLDDLQTGLDEGTLAWSGVEEQPAEVDLEDLIAAEEAERTELIEDGMKDLEKYLGRSLNTKEENEVIDSIPPAVLSGESDDLDLIRHHGDRLKDPPRDHESKMATAKAAAARIREDAEADAEEGGPTDRLGEVQGAMRDPETVEKLAELTDGMGDDEARLFRGQVAASMAQSLADQED